MLKQIALSVIILSTSLLCHAQSVSAQRKPVNSKNVPKSVSSVFEEQYPDVLLRGWYATHLTYWQNDYSSDWYNGWYGPRTVVVHTYEKPNYYEVEFNNKYGELSRAFYNIHGYWYETRTKLGGLPIGIVEALKTSKYSGWKVSPMKEKIETPMWPMDVYRFQVSKGMQARILRMDEEGNMIQAKDLDR